MKFQNFLDRLIAGDIYTFVVFGIVALIVFIICSVLYRVLHPYKNFVKFVAILLLALGVYAWFINPERMEDLFKRLAAWVTERVEPLVVDENENEYRLKD